MGVRSANSIPVETRLVILLCRTPLSDEARRQCSEIIETGVEWDLLLRRAQEWEMEPVVLRNLRMFFNDEIPLEMRNQIISRERAARALAAGRGLATLDVARNLKEAGIDTIVVKGAALAVAAYDDLSLRTYSDIDLLVRHENMERARNLLIARGYVPLYTLSAEPALVYQQHALELTNGAIKVELHGSLLSRYLRLEFDNDELFRSAADITLPSGLMRVLAPHHLLLYLCAHGAKHRWGNPRSICDIAQLLERLSPSGARSTIDLAAALNATRILSVGILAAKTYFAARIPEEVDAMLSVDQSTAALIDGVSRRLFLFENVLSRNEQRLDLIDPAFSAVIYWAKCRERARDRLGSIIFLILKGSSSPRDTGHFAILKRLIRLSSQVPHRLLFAAVRTKKRGA